MLYIVVYTCILINYMYMYMYINCRGIPGLSYARKNLKRYMQKGKNAKGYHIIHSMDITDLDLQNGMYMYMHAATWKCWLCT